MTLTVGSLFSGIGGFDLGLERAGMRVLWQVENDPYCQRVLAKHWPEVAKYGDIKEIDWAEVERPDLICGGFPCQPVSVAGKQRGTEDDRWLWPEFARCLRVVRPRFVLVENVPGLLSGPMGEVLGDLACLGYDAEWEDLPAAAFGAPHLRYRVWIVAHADRGRLKKRGERHGQPEQPPQPTPQRNDPDGCNTDVAHPDALNARHGNDGGSQIFRENPAAEGDFGWWRVEPDVGRVAHGVPRRVDRLRGLGNAIVPQIAEWLGRRILEVA